MKFVCVAQRCPKRGDLSRVGSGMRPLRHGCGVWAVLWAIAAVAGCGQPESARPTPLTEPPRSVGVRIEEGSAVPLILLKQVDSGSPVGSTVPFAVAEDVVADGNVLIAKGTLVTARVVASRAAGALSGLERRPARLSIVLDSVTAEDGQKLALAGVNHAPADEPLVLTRDSSESTPASPGLDNLSQTAEGKRMLSGLADRLKTGDGLDDPATRNGLGDLVARLSPTERGAAPAARATGSPLEFAARLRRGGSTRRLSPPSIRVLSALLFRPSELRAKSAQRCSMR